MQMVTPCDAAPSAAVADGVAVAAAVVLVLVLVFVLVVVVVVGGGGGGCCCPAADIVTGTNHVELAAGAFVHRQGDSIACGQQDCQK